MKTYKLHLSPYGTFEHPEGLQSISSADAQRCIRKTRTWRFRLGLKKIPVYLGHPDDPLFKNEHSDMHIYGYVKNLCADRDGLWVFVKLTKYGHTFLSKSPRQYLSPRWVLCKNETQTSYHPERLLSVGLTQHPNLPVHPIAFEVSKKKTFGLRVLLRALTKRQRSTETSHTQTGGVRFDSGIRKFFTTFIKHLRQMFLKKSQTDGTDRQTATSSPPLPLTPDEGTFSGHRTPLSSDLRGMQTREEKRRILQFGQAVRARMKATGESYPEAWNVLLHQTPAVFENNHSEETQDERSDGSKTRPRRGNFVPQSLKPMTATE